MSGEFDGSSSMLETYRRVRSNCGTNAAWLTEFVPIYYEPMNFFVLLLEAFMWHGICCAIVGNFPAYLAGIFCSFNRVELAIVVTRNPGLYDILQRGRRYSRSFKFGQKFRFVLKTNADNYFTYRVLLDDLLFFIRVYPVYSSRGGGRLSNLNLVHYFWDNCTVLSCRKYSMVILAMETPNHSRPFFLKHYRAESDGWTSRLFCDSCATYSTRRVQNYISGCTKTYDCKCNVCLRQPPTLKNLASHSVFNILFDSDRFVLSSTTTYEEYKFVVNSKKVSNSRLLPQNFPFPNFVTYITFILGHPQQGCIGRAVICYHAST